MRKTIITLVVALASLVPGGTFGDGLPASPGKPAESQASAATDKVSQSDIQPDAPDAEVWLDTPRPGQASVLLDGIHPGLRCVDTLFHACWNAPTDDPAERMPLLVEPERYGAWLDPTTADPTGDVAGNDKE